MVELVPVETDIDRSYRDGRISLADYERLKKDEIREKLERRLGKGGPVHDNNRRASERHRQPRG